MNKLFSILMIFIFAVAMVACSSEQKAETKAEAHGHSHELKPVAIAVNSVSELSTPIDPVCNMTLNDDMLQSAVEYDGQKIGFCNANCAAKFAENPEKFAAISHEGHDHGHEGHNH